MKLSDAIALGRTLVPRWTHGELEGCALGMALLATGQPVTVEGSVPNYWAIRETWPWLNDLFWMERIYQRFDNEVCNGSLSLDELIDWVRSIEPPEPPAVEDARLSMEELADVT